MNHKKNKLKGRHKGRKGEVCIHIINAYGGTRSVAPRITEALDAG
jgi:hypothetical protein